MVLADGTAVHSQLRLARGNWTGGPELGKRGIVSAIGGVPRELTPGPGRTEEFGAVKGRCLVEHIGY
jgi:hypothetical protein